MLFSVCVCVCECIYNYSIALNVDASVSVTYQTHYTLCTLVMYVRVSRSDRIYHLPQNSVLQMCRTMPLIFHRHPDCAVYFIHLFYLPYLSPLRLLHLFWFLFAQDGYTPLHLAADRGRKVIVQLLLDNDADFMAIEKARELRTILRICIHTDLHF
jgi:hypothetical protein